MTLGIAYTITGQGEPIIFIHGIGSTGYAWKGVIQRLKDQYQCITYDLRGHGDSKYDTSDFILDDLVNDLEKLRLHLKLKKIHLVGHSLGGMIGPAYARKFSKNVLTISMLSTAAFRSNTDKQKILDIIEEIKKNGLDSILLTFKKRWFTDNFILKNPEVITKRMDQLKKTNLKTFLRVFWIYATYEMDKWLNNLQVPCLLMTGQYDLSCNPGLNKKMANVISKSKIKILKDLKHTIILESPSLVGLEIRKFLTLSKSNY